MMEAQSVKALGFLSNLKGGQDDHAGRSKEISPGRFDDEDDIIQQELDAAESLWHRCSGRTASRTRAVRLSVVAVLYALAYLNEHREEADHHALTITLRNLLFGERDARF
jgi:hypothetical protein